MNAICCAVLWCSVFSRSPLSRQDPKPKGCIVVKGTYVAPTKKVNREYAFEVSDSRTSKVYFIHASSREEMDSWVEVQASLSLFHVHCCSSLL